MARGYQAEVIKRGVLDMLAESKTGMSGVEISEKIGVSRVTMAKYLKVFAAERIIRQKKMGGTTVWHMEEGTEQFRFPDDYFLAQKSYQDALKEYSEGRVCAIIRNCVYSGARASRIATEVIMPAVVQMDKLYNDGKIGDSEKSLLDHIASSSIHLLSQAPCDADPKKNAVFIAAESDSVLLCEAASASFKNEGWNVSMLGDMSKSVDVIFDLDLQKFLGRVWRQKPGIMEIVVFSRTEQGLNFFAESVNSAKEKINGDIMLVLCGKIGKKTQIKADLISDDLGVILQWSQTTYESTA